MSKISVIVPTYNLAAYICQTIDSVLAQSYKDFELIIIDDGSTDNTRQVVSHYGNKIKYIYQDNKGVAAARNMGIRESQGEYVAFIDADDIWLADKLMKQVAIVQENPDVDVFFSDAEVFNDKGVTRPSYRRSYAMHYDVGTFRHKIENLIINDGSILKGDFYKDLIMGNLVTPSTYLIRKKSLEEVGFFDEGLSVVDDFDLGLRLSRTHAFLYFNSITARYRLRDDSVSGKVNQRGFFYKTYDIQVLEKELLVCAKPYKDLINKRILESYLTAIWGYYNILDFKRVRKLCLSSLRKNKFQMKLYLYLLATLLPPGFIKSGTPL